MQSSALNSQDAPPLCRILLTNGHILSWKDLGVGESINIYNTVYHMHSCDAFTRAFMARHGAPQQPDHDPPLDEYHAHLLERRHLEADAAARFAAQHAAEKPSKGSLHNLQNTGKVRLTLSACSQAEIVPA